MKKKSIFLFLLTTLLVINACSNKNNFKDDLYSQQEKKQTGSIKLIIPKQYSEKEQIELSDETIQQVDQYINDNIIDSDDGLNIIIPGTFFINQDGKKKPAFVGAFINTSNHVYSDLIYSFSILRKDSQKIILSGETLEFKKNNYGELNKDKAFLIVIPFPEGLDEEIYSNPGSPEMYEFSNFMISQVVDGKVEKTE